MCDKSRSGLNTRNMEAQRTRSSAEKRGAIQRKRRVLAIRAFAFSLCAPLRSLRLISLSLVAHCLLLALLPLSSFAQDQTQKEATIRLDTDLVTVDVSVSDRGGNRAVKGLKQSDFTIFEDGVRQKIDSFSAIDTPFNLVLLVDTSGSTRADVELMRRAAARFLDEVRPQDRVALVQFNREVELLADLTGDRQKIENALAQLKPGTGTSFYDALQLTLDEVFKNVTGRKAVIALTDGVDSFGFTTYDQILPALEAARISFYFLELDTEGFTESGMMRDCKDEQHFEFSAKQLKKYVKEILKGGSQLDYYRHCLIARADRMQINRRLYEAARSELREIAAKTGGRVYAVKDVKQLEPAYAQIAAELHTIYTLAYYPTNEKRDGRWRSLKVDLAPVGLTAQTRTGYRAPRN